MKLAKILIIFTFLLVFVLQVSAQNYFYPNEQKGFELFKNGKWKTLKPFVSTKSDVEKIFGKNCEELCDYDENWSFQVMYIGQCSSYSASEKKFVPRVEEDLLGKYQNIIFYPKKRFTRKSFNFGKKWSRLKVEESHQIPSKTIQYNDSSGMVYRFWDENSEDGKFKVGDLNLIIYGIPDTDFEKHRKEYDC